MLPVATTRASSLRIALAKLRWWLRPRGIPTVVAIAWLGALLAFAWASRPNGRLDRAHARIAIPATIAITRPAPVHCAAPPELDTCQPDEVLGDGGHTRITHRPCKWQLPPHPPRRSRSAARLCERVR